MCGIAGVYGLTNSQPEHLLFKRLLMVNVNRGEHSTGIVKVVKKGNERRVHTQRSMLASPAYVFSKEGKEFLSDPSGSNNLLLLGHTRHATKGDINIKNAHPFAFKNVIGIHNGTIGKAFKGTTDYGTDSEALYALINEVGLEEALKTIADKDPKYALVFVDKKENTLNFIRNSARPLFFTYIYGRTGLAWSSRKEDLEYCIKMGNLTPKGWDKEDSKSEYFYLEPNNLLSLNIGDAANSGTITKLDIPVHTTVTTYYSGQHNVMSNHDDYGDEWWARYDKQKAEEKKNRGHNYHDRGKNKQRSNDTANKLSNIPWLDEPARAPKTDGAPETEKELTFRLGCGCFSCGVVVDQSDSAEFNRIEWWNREYYACGDCFENVSGTSDWVRRTIEDDWPVDQKKVN